MLDRDGYRPNVGIILCNAKNQVFWGKRVREHSWQFPQGGIKPARDWLRYDVPTHWVRRSGAANKFGFIASGRTRFGCLFARNTPPRI